MTVSLELVTTVSQSFQTSISHQKNESSISTFEQVMTIEIETRHTKSRYLKVFNPQNFIEFIRYWPDF